MLSRNELLTDVQLTIFLLCVAEYENNINLTEASIRPNRVDR